MGESFQKYCEGYFAKLKAGNNIKTGADTAAARDKNVASYRATRSFVVVKDTIKSDGPDVVSNFQLDRAVINAYQSVPLPSGQESKVEHHFLVFEEGGIFKPSKHFEMPENGGAVNYACQLGMLVDWSKVVAAAHTHPLYKNSSVNRLNEHFSQGDPSILIIKGIPLFLRTPKGKHIKVLEIRNGWVTTRNITPSKESKPEKWKARS